MTDHHLRTWDAWHKEHQVFELAWWKDALLKGHSCDDAEFAKQWNPVRKFINRGWGEHLDIGCGPRPPFTPCVVIDPLAGAYQEITPKEWWDNVYAFSRPAEHIIPDIVGEFDVVICWNCLDHSIGWRDILANMAAYGKPDCRYAVATDFFEPFVGHPGFERADFMSEIGKHFEIIDQREPFGRQLALLMARKP